MKKIRGLILTGVFISLAATVLSQDWKKLAPPEIGKVWVQPVQGQPAQPVWGHANGISIGLSPLPGPRGLLRIYTPYLNQPPGRIMNFIAMEPIVKGSQRRGLSELEMSSLDNRRGKRFWSGNDSSDAAPRPEDMPARGIVEKINGKEVLTIYVFSEPFESEAKVYVRIRFYADSPYEIEMTTYKMNDSKALDNFIVTATMGNFARLRTLFLKSGKKTSSQLWPAYSAAAFTPHVPIPGDDFIQAKNGAFYFIAAPGEQNPTKAEYASGTAEHWKYIGNTATQYWKYPESKDVEGLVNGRYTYWASQSPIPGGISFENFELKTPFKQGSTFTFGISPLNPEQFLKELEKKNGKY